MSASRSGLRVTAPMGVQVRVAPDQRRGCQMLLACGWASPRELFGRVLAWQALFETVQPTLVLMDYAPTALLAAQSMPRLDRPATAWMGGGFFCPPVSAPIPPFIAGADLERAASSEGQVLQSIRRVQQTLALQPLARLGELLRADRRFLCTSPELDTYPGRADIDALGAHYLGPCFASEPGRTAAWPEGSASRIFCYLKSGHPQLEPMLDALHRLDVPVLAYVPGLPEQARRRHASGRLVFLDRQASALQALVAMQMRKRRPGLAGCGLARVYSACSIRRRGY